jgi:hypothetical protein
MANELEHLLPGINSGKFLNRYNGKNLDIEPIGSPIILESNSNNFRRDIFKKISSLRKENSVYEEVNAFSLGGIVYMGNLNSESECRDLYPIQFYKKSD